MKVDAINRSNKIIFDNLNNTDFSLIENELLNLNKEEAKSFFNYLLTRESESSFKIMFMIGCCYIDGIGTNVNLAEGLKYLRNAIEGVPSDTGLLAHSVVKGLDDDNNEAFNRYLKVSSNPKEFYGKSKAEYNLACSYLFGLGTKIDLAKAFEYFAKAVNHKDFRYPLAFYNLSLCYKYGIGTKEDNKLAKKYSNKFKLLNLFKKYDSYPKRIFPRGNIAFYSVVGVEPNPKNAFKLFKSIADNTGNVGKAQYNVYKCYSMGFGCKKDDKLALEYLQKAINNHYYEALAEIGRNLHDFYDHSQPFDYESAIKYLEDAIKERPNDGKSHLYLAECYKAESLYEEAINEYMEAERLGIAIPHKDLEECKNKYYSDIQTNSLKTPSYSDVFISFNSRTSDHDADIFVNELGSRGISAFDSNVTNNEEISTLEYCRIKDAKVYIILITEGTLLSYHCNKEYQIMLEEMRRYGRSILIPIQYKGLQQKINELSPEEKDRALNSLIYKDLNNRTGSFKTLTQEQEDKESFAQFMDRIVAQIEVSFVHRMMSEYRYKKLSQMSIKLSDGKDDLIDSIYAKDNFLYDEISFDRCNIAHSLDYQGKVAKIHDLEGYSVILGDKNTGKTGYFGQILDYLHDANIVMLNNDNLENIQTVSELKHAIYNEVSSLIGYIGAYYDNVEKSEKTFETLYNTETAKLYLLIDNFKNANVNLINALEELKRNKNTLSVVFACDSKENLPRNSEGFLRSKIFKTSPFGNMQLMMFLILYCNETIPQEYHQEIQEKFLKNCEGLKENSSAFDMTNYIYKFMKSISSK